MKWSEERKESHSVKMKEKWASKRSVDQSHRPIASVVRANAVPPDNLPVPVLAEPRATDALCEGVSMASEAREGTFSDASRRIEQDDLKAKHDSCGGQNLLNAVDQRFEDKKPGYYIFEKTIQLDKDGKGRVCWYCKKPFQTRLSMNKFCCPEHKEAWLVASLRRGE